jgi:hypothetical protein
MEFKSNFIFLYKIGDKKINPSVLTIPANPPIIIAPPIPIAISAVAPLNYFYLYLL